MKQTKTQDVQSRTKSLAVIISAVILAAVIMVSLFAVYFNKVYTAVLEKNMEQIEWTSHYVTKLIHTEIQHSIDTLQASEEIFHQSKNVGLEEIQRSLHKIREELHFEKMGVVGLDGTSMDDAGTIEQIEDPQLFEHILRGENYTSNVLAVSDNMLIAVPLCQGGQIVGALWSHLSISSISQSIEMDKELHRYFQIVDDNGNYISHSGNIHSFAEDLNIWKELERYTFTGEVTSESIKKDISEGRSGYFHFTYKNQGRYVTYEPLGINNWYVFSVVVESFLKDYAENIERIFVGSIPKFV